MAINKDRLELALSTFSTFRGLASRSGAFENLYGQMHLSSSCDQRIASLKKIASYVVEDLWNLQTLILRLDWERKRYEKGELSDGLWMDFASSDIMLFHVTLRSIFDYVAQLTKILSIRPGQVPDTSFDRLRNFVQVPSNRTTRIGELLADVISSCEWFPDIKNTRDSIVHRGGLPIVFPEKRKILFQIHLGLGNQIFIPEVMKNNNVVIFELYAGMISGYLFAFLEHFSTVGAQILGISDLNKGATSTHPGLDVVKRWISNMYGVPPATGT